MQGRAALADCRRLKYKSNQIKSMYYIDEFVITYDRPGYTIATLLYKLYLFAFYSQLKGRHFVIHHLGHPVSNLITLLK